MKNWVWFVGVVAEACLYLILWVVAVTAIFGM